jgi:hypothetical protein
MYCTLYFGRNKVYSILFYSIKISCYKILYRARSDPGSGSASGFFQRSDPDPHQKGLDPQRWNEVYLKNNT